VVDTICRNYRATPAKHRNLTSSPVEISVPSGSRCVWDPSGAMKILTPSVFVCTREPSLVVCMITPLRGTRDKERVSERVLGLMFRVGRRGAFSWSEAPCRVGSFLLWVCLHRSAVRVLHDLGSAGERDLGRLARERFFGKVRH